MEDVNRSSLAIDGRDTMDVFLDDRQESERRVLQLQSELRHSNQLISSLSCINSGDAGQKLVELASENIKIREERDDLLKSKEALEAEKREITQANENKVTDLIQQLRQVESERNQFLQKCQQFEQQQEDEQSRFYQQNTFGRPTITDSSHHQFPTDRIQQRIESTAKDPQVNELYANMDQTEVSMMISRTDAAVENIEKYSKKATDYQSSIDSLFVQLKQTAKFLAQIVQSLGLDASQVELLVQKIEKLEFEQSVMTEMSERIVSDSKQMVNELSAVSTFLEQSMRQQSVVEPQTSITHTSNTNQAYEKMLVKMNELIEREELLMKEIVSLKDQSDAFCLERNDFRDQVATLSAEMREMADKYKAQVAALSADKRELAEKYDNALKYGEEQKQELDNREQIIEKLQFEAAGKRRLPSGLEEGIENQLQQIYTTLSDVNNRVSQKKH